MAEDQNKKIAEKSFWESWGKLGSNAANNAGQKEDMLRTGEPNRRDALDYAAKIVQQQAAESRKDNLKLAGIAVAGFFAIFLIVYLLGLINMKPEAVSAGSGETSQQSANQDAVQNTEMSEVELEQVLAEGGFATKEAYYGSVLKKQSSDIGDDLNEFSKKIKAATPKMNVTALVIAKKMEQFTKNKVYKGFGIELAGHADSESDNVKLISHLNGQTSPVEFFAEDGRIVAHFKDYPKSYCASTNGAAVCGE
jgi:hypothetical protein